MKIYVITKGKYSDYHICAVSTDAMRAARLAELYTDRYDDAKVEEYDTDSDTDILDTGRIPYRVTFTSRGEVYRVDKKVERREIFNPRIVVSDATSFAPERIHVYLFAPSKEAAVKIAAEKRAVFLAEREGLV